MRIDLTVPKKINVGYQTRKDTYTGKLAYVIYWDQKNKLRKETSWEGWRDKTIDPQAFDNVPTEGFVLNKQVGGKSWSSWNTRHEYCRVYDPRGFEFEISFANLLFILQECSAIKGKGLEGEFVYSWDGKELLLLPTNCKEYKESVEYTDMQTNKVGKDKMIPGCIYMAKDRSLVMYMGRFDWVEKKIKNYRQQRKQEDYDHSVGICRHIDISIVQEKRHVFLKMDKVNNNESRKYRDYWVQSGFTKIANIVSQEPDQLFATEYEALVATGYTSKPISFVVKEGTKIPENNYSFSIGLEENNKYYIGYCSVYQRWYNTAEGKYDDKKSLYGLYFTSEIVIEDGVVKFFYETSENKGYYNKIWERKHFKKENLYRDDAIAMSKQIYVKCENGSEYDPCSI